MTPNTESLTVSQAAQYLGISATDFYAIRRRVALAPDMAYRGREWWLAPVDCVCASLDDWATHPHVRGLLVTARALEAKRLIAQAARQSRVDREKRKARAEARRRAEQKTEAEIEAEAAVFAAQYRAQLIAAGIIKPAQAA